MKRIIFTLFTILTLLSGCKTNQCDLDLRLLESLQNRYNQSRDDRECKIFKDAIKAYLADGCTAEKDYLEPLISRLNCGIFDIPPCENDIQDGDETGVDCGGPDCEPCIVPPSCTDGIQNGNETGVDCGGSCDPCIVPPSCSDGVQNGNETGIDCGGSCDPCSAPTCNDGIQNGDETGVDCGGSCPMPCSNLDLFFSCLIENLNFEGSTTGDLPSEYSSILNSVIAFSGSDETSNIIITFGEIPIPGKTYLFLESIDGFSNVAQMRYLPNTAEMATWNSIDSSGSITVTEFDLFSGITSGTFSCEVFNSPNISEIKEITNGTYRLEIN